MAKTKAETEARMKRGGRKAAADRRCWGEARGDLMRDYHDLEWGTPLHDDRKIFEFLVLEGMQAGLSWTLILNKRENFRRAFRGFDPEKVARFAEAGRRAAAGRTRGSSATG